MKVDCDSARLTCDQISSIQNIIKSDINVQGSESEKELSPKQGQVFGAGNINWQFLIDGQVSAGRLYEGAALESESPLYIEQLRRDMSVRLADNE